jgi:hypothetical protein
LFRIPQFGVLALDQASLRSSPSNHKSRMVHQSSERSRPGMDEAHGKVFFHRRDAITGRQTAGMFPECCQRVVQLQRNSDGG